MRFRCKRRRRRRSLQLDCLPLPMLDRIRAERNAGRSWAEIEQSSPQWPEWELAGAEALACFPHRRLPHSSLQRWYDLRVEQLRRDQERQALAAHALADQLAGRGFTDLTAAVKNALGETVFKLMLADSDLRVQIAALTSLARLLLQLDRNQISRERLQIERRKVRLLARKLETEKARSAQKSQGRKKQATGNSLTPEDIDRIRSRVFGLPPVTIPEPSHPGQSTAGLPGAHEPPPPSDDGGVAAEPGLPSPHPADPDQTALAGQPGCSGTAQDLVQDFGALSRQGPQPGARLIPPHPASNHRTRLRQRGPQLARCWLAGAERGPQLARCWLAGAERGPQLARCWLAGAGGWKSRRSCFPGPARASPMPNRPAL